MTNKKLLKKLNTLSSHLEYNKENEETKKDAYYCFTSKSLTGKTKNHRFLSDLLYNAEVSTNYAYQFLSETLDTLIDLVPDDEDEADTDNILDSLYEYLPEEFYTYNHTKFIHDGNSEFIDEAVQEYDCKENIIGYAYRLAQERQCYSFASEILNYLTK